MTLEEIKKMFGGVVEIYNNGEYIVGEENVLIFDSEDYYFKDRLFKRIKKNSTTFTEIKPVNGEEFIILEDSPLFNEDNDCNWLHCIIDPTHFEDDEQFVIITDNKLFTIGPICKNIELK